MIIIRHISLFLYPICLTKMLKSQAHIDSCNNSNILCLNITASMHSCPVVLVFLSAFVLHNLGGGRIIICNFETVYKWMNESLLGEIKMAPLQPKIDCRLSSGKVGWRQSWEVFFSSKDQVFNARASVQLTVGQMWKQTKSPNLWGLEWQRRVVFRGNKKQMKRAI